MTVASCGAEGVGNVGGGLDNLGSLVLRSSSVRDSTADDGGNIYNAVGATLTATDSALVSGDASSHGGNLHNRGSATSIRCRVYGGTGFRWRWDLQRRRIDPVHGHARGQPGRGGWRGIYMQSGSLEVANSLLHLNVTVFATGQGGGALIAGGSAVFHDTTFYANGSPSGGAVFQDSSTAVRLENCTLSYNSASGSGGGLYVTGTRRAKIRSSTVVSNVADVEGDGAGDGGGIFLEPCSGTCPTDRVFLANSIVAGNLDGSPGGPFAHDCSGLLTSEGYDLVQDASTGTIGTCRVDGDTGGVLVQVAPLLSDLGDNGGPPTILGATRRSRTPSFRAARRSTGAIRPAAPTPPPRRWRTTSAAPRVSAAATSAPMRRTASRGSSPTASRAAIPGSGEDPERSVGAEPGGGKAAPPLRVRPTTSGWCRR